MQRNPLTQERDAIRLLLARIKQGLVQSGITEGIDNILIVAAGNAEIRERLMITLSITDDRSYKQKRTPMLSIEKSCCFTGHRPKFYEFGTDETHPKCLKIKAFIRKWCEYLIRERGVIHFISGGALGVDTWAMEVVIDLKNTYPHITLECVLPYVAMPDRFSPEDRARYDAIMKKCDVKTAVCPKYTGRDCLDKRNEYMVDHAKYLIAVWLGIMTGTGRTVEYARKLGREIICYDFTN